MMGGDVDAEPLFRHLRLFPSSSFSQYILVLVFSPFSYLLLCLTLCYWQAQLYEYIVPLCFNLHNCPKRSYYLKFFSIKPLTFTILLPIRWGIYFFICEKYHFYFFISKVSPFLSFSFHISEGIFLLPIHNTKILIAKTNPQTVISIGYIWRPFYKISICDVCLRLRIR